MQQIWCATGHRPQKLGGFSRDAEQIVYGVAERYLRDNRPDKMITGMALGWDTAVALACISLKIPFVAAIPFAGQDRNWNAYCQQRYAKILQKADTVEVISPGRYRADKMHKRNEWMVDRSIRVVALFDGVEEGGTYRCIEYAKKRQRHLVNLWSDYDDTIVKLKDMHGQKIEVV